MKFNTQNRMSTFFVRCRVENHVDRSRPLGEGEMVRRIQISDLPRPPILFFTAILPQFIDTNHSIAAQIVILGLSSIVVEFFILFGYGQLAGRTLSAVKNPRFEKISNRIAGSLLIGAGLGLARLSRT